MKVIFVAVILGGCLFLAASRCSVEVYSSGSVANGPASPAVNDVLAIRDAAVGSKVDEPIFDLLNRASSMNRGPGATLIEQQLSARTETANTNVDLVRERIGAVAVQTSAGAYCRTALLRFVAQDQWLFQRLASDVAQKRSTWKAVDRFGSGFAALTRSYGDDLDPCISAAPSEDRYAIQQAMRLS